MSNFTNQLELALERIGMSRVELSQKTGINYGTLTNYALGRHAPDREAMRVIMASMPIHEAAQLLAERLRDEVPDGHSGLLLIAPNDSVLVEETPANYGHPLPAKLEEAMRKLRAAVIKSPAWADIVEDIAKVLP